MQELWTTAAGIVGGAAGGFLLARRQLSGPFLSQLVERLLESRATYQHPVVIVGEDDLLAARLRTTLLQRNFRTVRIEGADYRANGRDAVVVLAEGFDVSAFAHRAGLGEGLLYTTQRAEPPSGDWTFANSPISLHARLRELIEWMRASSTGRRGSVE